MDLEVIRTMLHVLMSVYPERIYKLLVYDAPYFFTAAWTVIKPWLDENSINKISFPRKRSKLFEVVREDSVPPALGGTSVFNPAQYQTSSC